MSIQPLSVPTSPFCVDRLYMYSLEWLHSEYPPRDHHTLKPSKRSFIIMWGKYMFYLWHINNKKRTNCCNMSVLRTKQMLYCEIIRFKIKYLFILSDKLVQIRVVICYHTVVVCVCHDTVCSACGYTFVGLMASNRANWIKIALNTSWCRAYSTCAI